MLYNKQLGHLQKDTNSIPTKFDLRPQYFQNQVHTVSRNKKSKAPYFQFSPIVTDHDKITVKKLPKHSRSAKSLKNIAKTLNEICQRVNINVQENKQGSHHSKFNFQPFRHLKKTLNECVTPPKRQKPFISPDVGRKTCPNILKEYDVSPSDFMKQKYLRSERSSYKSQNLIQKSKKSNESPKRGQRIDDIRRCQQIFIKSEEKAQKTLNEIKKWQIDQKQQSQMKIAQGLKITQSRENIGQKKQKKKMGQSCTSMSTFQSSMTVDDTLHSNILQRKRIAQVYYRKPEDGFLCKVTDFIILKNLGEGKFGNVYLTAHKQTGMIVALKKIDKEKVKKFNMIKQVMDEIKIHLSLNHPNIIKLYGIFDDEKNIYLILQSIYTGTLFDLLNEKEKISVAETVEYIKGVTKGIQYMHNKCMAHRDIKPENILIADSGIAKLCDMGWSAIITSSRKTYCGTFDYVAPQILQRKNYDLSVDIWCIGALTYELLLGKMPYEGDRGTIICKKINNAQLEFSKDTPTQAKDFIMQLLRKNPEQRPKCKQILQHPFLSLKN